MLDGSVLGKHFSLLHCDITVAHNNRTNVIYLAAFESRMRKRLLLSKELGGRKSKQCERSNPQNQVGLISIRIVGDWDLELCVAII